MAFNRKVQYEILPRHVITLDAEDLIRVQSRQWKSLPGEQVNTARFFTNIGTEARQVYQLLGGFILGVKATQFVDLVDKSPAGMLDYRKKNLKVK